MITNEKLQDVSHGLLEIDLQHSFQIERLSRIRQELTESEEDSKTLLGHLFEFLKIFSTLYVASFAIPTGFSANIEWLRTLSLYIILFALVVIFYIILVENPKQQKVRREIYDIEKEIAEWHHKKLGLDIEYQKLTDMLNEVKI
jgi:hypothetical protein